MCFFNKTIVILDLFRLIRTLKRVIRQERRIRSGRVEYLIQRQTNRGVSITVGGTRLTLSSIACIPHEALLTQFTMGSSGVILATSTRRQFVVTRTGTMAITLTGRRAVGSHRAKVTFARPWLDTQPFVASLWTHRHTHESLHRVSVIRDLCVPSLACTVETRQCVHTVFAPFITGVMSVQTLVFSWTCEKMPCVNCIVYNLRG